MEHIDIDSFLEQLGKRIRILRKERNLSQRELGLKSLLEKSVIQRIERGLMNCTIKTMLKIASALDLEYAELFDFSEKNDP